jgi:hypothetical protein
LDVSSSGYPRGPSSRAPWRVLQWTSPSQLRTGGQGQAGGATHSGNTVYPSKNGSSPVFNDRPKSICPRPPTMGCIMAQAVPQIGHGPVFKVRHDPSPSTFWIFFSETGGPNMYYPVSKTLHGHNMTHSVKDGHFPVSKWALCPFSLSNIINSYEFTT